MSPVQQAKEFVLAPQTTFTLSGIATLFSVLTYLGYLGPKEQLADMRKEVTQYKTRVEAAEQAINAIREDVTGIAIFACVQTRNQVVYAQLRCNVRFGTTIDPTP